MGENINPMGNLYNSFMYLINNAVIKFTRYAEDSETLDSKRVADAYLDAINKKDSFFSYIDYTRTDLISVGITNKDIIDSALMGEIREIPERFREPLLEIRRKREISEFEEGNDYYRKYNGYPNLDDDEKLYIPIEVADYYGIDRSIPIHRIQDYYNSLEKGKGDYFIHLLEGLGFVKELIQKYPDKEYLKYIGSERIGIETLRKSKNFQILKLTRPDVKDSLIDEFIKIYDSCREYFVTTIYNYNYGRFIERYDNFIGMCIMLMTLQQVVQRQLSSFISRDFFDIQAVRTLYDAYNVPYDLNIDEITQNNLLRNLNLFIQNKATDKVIYDLSYLLGFTNIKVYKYFLSKERKFDSFGVPIVKWKEKFNTNTGLVEKVPDYEAMYNLYFQKFEVRDDDFQLTFNDQSNHVRYEDVTKADPYWIEDQSLYDRVWNTTYNFVESKYLSLGVSYNLTDIMFENVLLIKMLMRKSDDIEDIRVKLPKITGDTLIPIFDVIVALICLTSAKHNLYGEIITIPSQVIHVVDYLKQKENADLNLDPLKFNYNYLFNPDADDNTSDVDDMKNTLINFMKMVNKQDFLSNTFEFDFDYLDKSKPETADILLSMENVLSESDYRKFRTCVEIIMQDVENSGNKITAINEIYTNIKELKTMLNYYLTKICNNRKAYEQVKTLYDALFYSEEMSEIFTITGKLTGTTRAAFTYFEFLYNRNPLLYSALFSIDMTGEYSKYLKQNSLTEAEFSYNDFLEGIEEGNIFIDYSGLLGSIDKDEKEYKQDRIYYYVNHIIGRLQIILDDVEYMYMMNDADTPLSDLLIRLVRFFKSYTVDVLGLDKLVVMNLKPENCMKLFDEFTYTKKLIDEDEEIRLMYADVVNRISCKLKFDDDDISMCDKFYREVWLRLTRERGLSNVNDGELNLLLRDDCDLYGKKGLVYDESQMLFDSCDSRTTLNMNTGIKMKDVLIIK